VVGIVVVEVAGGEVVVEDAVVVAGGVVTVVVTGTDILVVGGTAVVEVFGVEGVIMLKFAAHVPVILAFAVLTTRMRPWIVTGVATTQF
jgi:hypothetical protein